MVSLEGQAMDEPEFLKLEINSIVIHSRQSQWRGRQWGGEGGQNCSKIKSIVIQPRHGLNGGEGNGRARIAQRLKA